MIPVPIINILQSGVGEEKKLLAMLKIRSWLGQLLQRSILLGSLQEGCSEYKPGISCMIDGSSRGSLVVNFT